jgi:hypothetical protein
VVVGEFLIPFTIRVVNSDFTHNQVTIQLSRHSPLRWFLQRELLPSLPRRRSRELREGAFCRPYTLPPRQLTGLERGEGIRGQGTIRLPV